MINLEDIIRQLTVDAQAVHALIQTISDEQAMWKPTQDTWSLKEVMEHVYNEERMDFRVHLKEMLHDPPLVWGQSEVAYLSVTDCQQALEGFMSEREASLDWLKAEEAPNWDIRLQASFGLLNEVITFSAGDILVAWVEHDFLHLRQIIELLHAWNEKQASPYSVQYGGGW